MTSRCHKLIVTSEILQNVYQIRSELSGTGFRCVINKSDCLVTAKHLFKNPKHGEQVEIEILHTSGWEKVKAQILIHENNDIDIAVLKMQPTALQNSFAIDEHQHFISQECFFLGFPFGFHMDDHNINGGYPIAFVKKAIISAITSSQNGKVVQLFLDGHNNPGFSGGPVIALSTKEKFKVIGVVSAYVNDNKLIKTPFGDIVNPENSGIVIAYSFEHAIEIVTRK